MSVAKLEKAIRQQLKTNLVIVVNAGSLFSTEMVTSGLGFVFWWLAAHNFPAEIVGLSSAAISAMMLMGDIGKVGWDTLLVGELPRRPETRGALITTGLLITGSVGLGLGILFAYGAPLFNGEFRTLSQSLPNLLLFAFGVGLTSIGLVMDQALIGLLQGQIQLKRNAIFAAVKLVLLFLAGILLSKKYALLIYAAWVVGNLVSFAYVAVVGLSKTHHKDITFQPQFKLLHELGGPALKHYALNLTLKVPGYTLPLLVAALISVENTASFYAAWMIVNFLFALPYATTRVLFAVGSAQKALLSEKIRFTLKLSFIIGTLGAVGLVLIANPLMRLFGSNYADQATTALRILAISILPIIIKTHYVAISQIYGRMINAAKIMAVGSVLELSFAAVGAQMGGLSGLSVGWVLAVFIEGLLTIIPVYRMMKSYEPAQVWKGKSLW